MKFFKNIFRAVAFFFFKLAHNMDVNEDGFIQNWNPTLEDFQESES
jgi:hypothetical protein